jgi:hypothetical protein
MRCAKANAAMKIVAAHTQTLNLRRIAGLVRTCPELAVLANPDSAFENAIFKCLSFQQLMLSKCRHVPVPS